MDIPISESEAVTSEELLARARSLLPALRERASKTDAERRVPDETIEDFRRAGFLRLLTPRAYGGLEMTTLDQINISMELAASCGSSAWVFSLLCEHNWLIAMYPKDAQDEIWGDDPNRVASSSLAPNGEATRVNGGLRLTGRFPFSSGCDHVEWVILGGMVHDGPAQEAWLFLVPRAEVAIHDDWFVIGLRGTGSKTIVCEDVFIPEYRALRTADVVNARGPGRGLHADFLQLCMPRDGIAGFTHISASVGMAQGAVDTFIELARGHRRRGGSIANSGPIQMKLSESAAEVLSAKLLLRNAVSEELALVARGEFPTREDIARHQRDGAFASLLSMHAIDRLHTAYGARGIFDDNPLSRYFRDIHAAVAQFSQAWDFRALPYARIAMGQDPATAFSSE